MGFFSRLKRLMISADIDPVMFRKVLPEINESNRKTIQTFSVLAVIILTAMTVLSFVVPDLQGNRSLYFFSAIGMAIIAIVAKYFAKDNRNITVACTYVFAFILLMFGIILGTVTVADEVTATYIALLLTVPQLFTERPYRMYIIIGVSIAIFIVMVTLNKDPSIWSSDITNAIVFGVVSGACSTYMMKIKTERFYLEETIRYMAETDQLTGLKNRNSYEICLQKVSILKSKSIFCVYVDVNGLHELNNTMGHEAGDRMLQYIATVMQNIFGTSDTYRIGGDEYVAFGLDKEEDEVKAMIEKMKQAVEAAGYHVAVGMQYREKTELEMEDLVKDAEQKMYDDKRAYYEKNGIDRRRKR